MVDYETALKEWGARQLNGKINRETVVVNTGYQDGGGCSSCSYTTGGVEITGKTETGKFRTTFLDEYSYRSMAELVKEVVAIAEELEGANA